MAQDDILIGVGADVRNMRASIEKELRGLRISIDEQKTNFKAVLEKQAQGIRISFNKSDLQNLRNALGQAAKIQVSFDSKAAAQFRNSIQQYFDAHPVNIKVQGGGVNPSGGTIAPTGGDTQAIRAAARYNESLAKATTAAARASEDLEKSTRGNIAAITTFGERVGFTTTRLAAYLIPASAIFQISKGANFAAKSIVTLDTEINKLTQIMDGNAKKANEVAAQALNIGKNYGQSAKEVLSVVNVLAQAGNQFKTPEAIIRVTEALAKTNLAATFGNVEETTQGLIAVLNQFNLSFQDTNRVLDNANELSKRFAVESGDLFTAVQAGGSAFATAGGSIEEFNAVVTALRETTRLSASTIGTGLNTIALRSLRPDVIEFTENLTKSAGGSIRNADGSLKNITQRFIEIGRALRGATEEQVAFANEVLAGDRQGKLLIPLVRDIGEGEGQSTLLQALQQGQKTAGSLSRDAIIGLDRIDVQLKSIGTRFEQLFNTLEQNKGIQGLVKDFSSLAKSVADTVEVLAPVIPLLVKFAGIRLGLGVLASIPSLVRGGRQFVSRGDLINENGENAAPLGSIPFTRNTGGNISSRNVISANTQAVRQLAVATQQVASASAATAQPLTDLVKSAFNKASGPTAGPIAVTTSGGFSRFGTFHPRDVGRRTPPPQRAPLFNEEAAFNANLRNNPTLIARARQDYINRRTYELEHKPTGTARIKELLEHETRQRLIQERTAQLTSRTTPKVGFSRDISADRLLHVASEATLRRVEEAEKKGFSTERALQRFASPQERASAAQRQAREEIKDRPASFFKSQAITDDLYRAIQVEKAEMLAKATKQATQEAATLNITPSLLKRVASPSDLQQAAQGVQRQKLLDAASKRVPVLQGFGPTIGGSLSSFNIGGIESGAQSLGDAIRADQLKKNQAARQAYLSKITAQGEQDLQRIAASRASQSLSPEQLIGRPGAGFGPPSAAVIRAREEAVARSGVRGGLESRLSEVVGDKGILQTSVAQMTKELNSRVAQFKRQGATLEQVNRELNQFVTELNRQQQALATLTQEELELAGKLNTTSTAGLNAANAARTTGLRDKVTGGVNRLAGAGKGLLTAAAPALATILPSLILDSIGSSVGSGRQGLLDDQGNLKQDFAAISQKNRRTDTIQGTLSAASTGALIGGSAIGIGGGILGAATAGAAAGSVVPILGTAIGAAAGAIIGAVIGKTMSEEAAKNRSNQELLTIASSAQGFGGIARPLNTVFDRINSDIKGIGGFKFGQFGQADIPTQRQGIRELLRSEGGQPLLARIRTLATDEARNVPQGRNVSLNVQSRLTRQFAEQFQREGADRAEAWARAGALVEESFKELNGKTGELNSSLDKTNKSYNEAVKATNELHRSLNTLGASLTEFGFGFGQGTRNINANTANLGVGNTLASQLSDSLFGRAGNFQLPEQLGTIIGQNIQSALSGPGLSRAGASSVISQNAGGLLSGKDQAVFTDTALLQNFIQGTSLQGLRSLAGKTFNEGQTPDVGIGLERFIARTFADAPQLQTEEGANRLKEIQDSLLKQARSNPDAFRADPASFVQSFLGEFADGKIFMERFNAIIGNVNERLKTQTILYDRMRQPQERQLQVELQGIGTAVGRAREEGSVFGASSGSVIQSLNSILARSGGSGLVGATRNLQGAQRAEAELRAGITSPGDLVKNSKALADSQIRLRTAQDQYNDAVARSSSELNILRAKFEETSKVLANIIGSNQTIGSASLSERQDAGQALGRVRAFAGSLFSGKGPLAGVQNERDIGRALQQGRVTTGGLDAASARLGGLANIPEFQDALNTLEKFRGSSLPGGREGQTIGDLTGLLRTLAGAGSNPFGQGREDALKELIDASRNQVSASEAVRSVEDLQLDTLGSINSTLIEIAKRVGVDVNRLPTSNGPTPQAAAAAPTGGNDAARLQGQLNSIQQLAGFLGGGKSSGYSTEQLKDSLDKLAASIQGAQGNASKVDFSGNFNFSGFEAVGKDVVAQGAITKVMESFISQLKTGTPAEQELANKFTIALKLIQDKGK